MREIDEHAQQEGRKAGVWHSITEPPVLAGLHLSFSAASLAAAVNLALVWIALMVRYRFPGCKPADG